MKLGELTPVGSGGSDRRARSHPGQGLHTEVSTTFAGK